MMNTAKPLFDTQRALLAAAALRHDHLVAPPKLPAGAARQVIRSMLNVGLVEEVPAATNNAGYAWRTGDDGGTLMLRMKTLMQPVADAPTDLSRSSLTDARSVVSDAATASKRSYVGTSLPVDDQQDELTGVDRQLAAPAAAGVATDGPALARRAVRDGRQDRLRRAVRAVLEAWDGLGDGDKAIAGVVSGQIDDLRAALASLTPPDRGNLLPTRDTKQSRVLAMLRRTEGASGPQIAEAMGWAPNTVRGFLAGVRRTGIKVEVLERIRQVGPNKAGAKSSYTIYRIAG